MSQSYTRGVPIDPDPSLSNNSDLLVASQQATKTYVDNGLLTKQNVLGFTPVDKGGDTMIGNLILNADPTTGLQAATKQYVDSSGGITTLNTLTATTQTFATGTTGTDFNISSATSTHTFNLPDASALNRGALSSADWTAFNNKPSVNILMAHIASY